MKAREFGTHIKATRKAGQEFTGKCPSHDDQRASLSWRDGDKGVVVTCFAGCTIDDITGALGLKPAALFATNGRLPPISSARKAIAHYDYYDEAGALLYQVVRYEPKGFSQRRPDGAGGWRGNLDGVRRVLYRLPGLQGCLEVYVVEGERDADRLVNLKFAATTNAGGAAAWKQENTEQLVRAGIQRVIILPDNDPPGEAHGRKVAESCLKAGLQVKVISLPGLPSKGDVSDWLEAGHTVDELVALAVGTSPFSAPPPPPPHGVISFAEAMRAAISSQEGEPPEFISTPFPGLNTLLCGGMVPGELYYLAAKGGEGKSAMSLELARAVSRHDGVLVISQEMAVPAVSRRLLAQEGKVSARKMRQHSMNAEEWEKFYGAAGILMLRKGWIVSHAPTVEEMTAALSHTTGVKLVVVDYLQLLHGKGQDSRAQLEAVSRGLKAFALEHRVVVFCLSAVTTRGEGKQKPSMHWLRGCVTGDTRVCLADGSVVKIKTLVGKTPSVMTMNAGGRLVVATSSAVWPVGEREVFRVTLATGGQITATADHRILGGDGWRRVETLKKGDRVAIARHLLEPVAPQVMSENRIVLLAHLMGDGSYLRGCSPRYTSSSLENIKFVKEAAESEFGSQVSVTRGAGNWFDVGLAGNGNRWHSSGVTAWLKSLGIWNQRSREKLIPSEIFRLSSPLIALFLRHIWATDGTINTGKDGRLVGVDFSTASRYLADGILSLLLRVGIVGRLCKTKTWFSVRVLGCENQRRFLAVVGAVGPRVAPAEAATRILATRKANTNVDTVPLEVWKLIRSRMKKCGVTTRQMDEMRGTAYSGSRYGKYALSRAAVDQYAQLLGDERLAAIASSDIFWDSVVSVEAKGRQDVFDMTVPITQNWMAGGIVTHNSGMLEHDCDVALLLHQPDPASPERELIVAKARDAECGAIRLHFSPEILHFVEVEMHRQEPTDKWERA